MRWDFARLWAGKITQETVCFWWEIKRVVQRISPVQLFPFPHLSQCYSSLYHSRCCYSSRISKESGLSSYILVLHRKQALFIKRKRTWKLSCISHFSVSNCYICYKDITESRWRPFHNRESIQVQRFAIKHISEPISELVGFCSISVHYTVLRSGYSQS